MSPGAAVVEATAGTIPSTTDLGDIRTEKRKAEEAKNRATSTTSRTLLVEEDAGEDDLGLRARESLQSRPEMRKQWRMGS